MTFLLNYFGLGFIAVLAVLPFSWAIAFGKLIGVIAFHLPIERNRVVLTNLRLCFPHLSEAEIKQLAKAHWKLLGKSLAERGYLWMSSEKTIHKLVKVESAIDLTDGQPRVFVGMHMIGIEAGLIGLSIYLRDKGIKHPITLYVRMKNNFFDQKIKSWRERFGAKMVLRLHSTRELLREIRQGSFVLLSPDMDLGLQDSVFVPFFGVQTCTVTSISRLAQLGRAEVCPVVTTLNPDGKTYTCRIGKPWAHFPSDNILEDTTRMNQFFEEQVRKNPPEYYWVHKRFKNRPEGQARVY